MRHPPFFIVGCGRSGTTLLQTLLDAHPDIAIPPESFVYHRFGAIFDTYGDLRSSRCRRKLLRDLLRDRRIRAWPIQMTLDALDTTVNEHSRAGVIRALFRFYANAQGATRWGEKTPVHVHHMEMIREDFPDAKFIHLVRDGRDVSESQRRMIWGPVCPLGLARQWRNDVMAFRNHAVEIPASNVLVIHYETLVREPRSTILRVLEFLKVRPMNTLEINQSSKLRSCYTAIETHHQSLNDRISPSKIGIFKSAFTKREIEIFEYAAGDALEMYGYRREFASPQPPTRGHQLVMTFQDAIARYWRAVTHPAFLKTQLQERVRYARRRFGWQKN